MPEYVYFCSNCSEEFPIIQSMNDLRCADCPSCARVTKEVIPQLFGMADLTPRTLGALSDYNRKHMSQSNYDEAVQKMANDRKQLHSYAGKVPEGGSVRTKESFKEMPWAKDTLPINKINKMTSEQQTDYVLKGKVPIGI